MSRLADWLARAHVPERCSPSARRALSPARVERARVSLHGLRGQRLRVFQLPPSRVSARWWQPHGGVDGKAASATLPVPYFLVTVTAPEELRGLFATRPEAMHAVLFRESAAALQ